MAAKVRPRAPPPQLMCPACVCEREHTNRLTGQHTGIILSPSYARTVRAPCPERFPCIHGPGPLKSPTATSPPPPAPASACATRAPLVGSACAAGPCTGALATSDAPAGAAPVGCAVPAGGSDVTASAPSAALAATLSAAPAAVPAVAPSTAPAVAPAAALAAAPAAAPATMLATAVVATPAGLAELAALASSASPAPAVPPASTLAPAGCTCLTQGRLAAPPASDFPADLRPRAPPPPRAFLPLNPAAMGSRNLHIAGCPGSPGRGAAIPPGWEPIQRVAMSMVMSMERTGIPAPAPSRKPMPGMGAPAAQNCGAAPPAWYPAAGDAPGGATCPVSTGGGRDMSS